MAGLARAYPQQRPLIWDSRTGNVVAWRSCQPQGGRCPGAISACRSLARLLRARLQEPCSQGPIRPGEALRVTTRKEVRQSILPPAHGGIRRPPGCWSYDLG